MLRFRMTLRQYKEMILSYFRREPAKRPARPRRPIPGWFAFGRVYRAWTKSEVRAMLKVNLQVDRLPIGAGTLIKRLLPG